MIDPDDYIDLAPSMMGVPAVIGKATEGLDQSSGKQLIVVGAVHVPGRGPVIAVGLKNADGSSVIGLTNLECAKDLRAQLDRSISEVESGEFDQPERPS